MLIIWGVIILMKSTLATPMSPLAVMFVLIFASLNPKQCPMIH